MPAEATGYSLGDTKASDLDPQKRALSFRHEPRLKPENSSRPRRCCGTLRRSSRVLGAGHIHRVRSLGDCGGESDGGGAADDGTNQCSAAVDERPPHVSPDGAAFGRRGAVDGLLYFGKGSHDGSRPVLGTVPGSAARAAEDGADGGEDGRTKEGQRRRAVVLDRDRVRPWSQAHWVAA